MRRVSLGVLSIVAGLLVASGAFAENEITVRSEGMAVGSDGEALRDATRNAQLAAVADCLEDITRRGDLGVFKAILDRAPDYVASFRRLGNETEDDAVVVKIEARVLVDVLRRDAAAALLSQSGEPPRIVVLVAEAVGRDGVLAVAPVGVAEESIAAELRRAGLDVVTAEEVRSVFTAPELMGILRGDNEEGARLARGVVADAVVLGFAVAQPEPGVGGSNLTLSKAKLDLRVVCAENSTICDVVSADAKVHSAVESQGDSQAIQDACNSVSADLFARAVLVGMAREMPESMVVLTVLGLRDEGEYEEIVGLLRETDGVTGIEGFFGHSGVARARIQYVGEMAPLAKRIGGGAFSGFRLLTKSVVERGMEFEAER